MERRTNQGIASVQLGRSLYERYERAGVWPKGRLLQMAVQWYLEDKSVKHEDLGPLFRTSSVDTGKVPLLSADIGELNRTLVEGIAREARTSASAVLRAIVRHYLDIHHPDTASSAVEATHVNEPQQRPQWSSGGPGTRRDADREGEEFRRHTLGSHTDEIAIITAALRPLIPSSLCDKARPYGYPDDLVLCVIDDVFSINANYFGHVIPVLNRFRRYCDDRGATVQTSAQFLAEFASHLDDGGTWLAQNVFRNAQRTSTKSGILKALAVVEFIKILHEHGIETPSDLAPRYEDSELQRALARVPGDGLEDIRRDYLWMLVGRSDILKWDRQLKRFFQRHLGYLPTKARAYEILRAVVEVLRSSFPCLNVRMLDGFIWGEFAGVGSASDLEVSPNTPTAVGPLTTPSARSDGRESREEICLSCYRRGLMLYGSHRSGQVSQVTLSTYLSDGERFASFFESGVMVVKRSTQCTTPRERVSVQDLSEFIEALVRGGMPMSSAVVYGTPVRGAFAALDVDCTHRS